MEFDLRHLEVFCRVVELGSFSRAAEVVHLAQASVSERIANLESGIGTRLLDRLPRGVAPTAAGKVLYQHALALLEGHRQTVQAMRDLLGAEAGTLCIGASTTPGTYILPHYLSSFRQRHPGVALDVRIRSSEAVVEWVVTGAVEMGIVGSAGEHPDLEAQELWDDEVVLAVSPQHPLADRDCVPLEVLEGLPIVRREAGSATQALVTTRLLPLGLRFDNLPSALRIDGLDAYRMAIRSGVAPGFISLRAIACDLEEGCLRAIRLGGVDLTRHFYLVWDRRRARSNATQLLSSLLLGRPDVAP